MQVVHARCCGLDVHKKSVVACVLLTEPDGSVRRQVRTFGTMTADLLALDDWLTGYGVTQVAMESTGVYWRPGFNLLEHEERTITLVNAQHLKAVPGHKTDVKDSEWLADLLRHGLVKASFIPPAPIRELRELTRARKTLVQQRADAVNRVHKLLEGANIKLASVASNILGKSGRAMLDALLAGETDPDVLAALAYGQLRKKRVELRRALDGRLAAHQRLLLAQLLAQIDFLTDQIAQLADAIADRLMPMQEAVTLLQTIPGVSVTAAAAIIAEIGVDMARFPSAKHLASMGRALSREQAKRRQTAEGADNERQRLAEGGALGVRVGGGTHEGDVSGGAVQAVGTTTRSLQGDCRGRPQSIGDHLPCAPAGRSISGTGWRLFRADRQQACGRLPHQTADGAGLSGDADAVI
jgi:transposase